MPTSLDLILKNGNCFIDGQLKTVDIGISRGIIKKIGKIEQTSNEKVLDANNLTILPGIIDTQVHFREPGSTDVEDLESGSKAAVLGGIGSIPGAVIGGLLIGLIETFWSAYFTIEYKDVAVFSILVIVLIFRPYGILGKPEFEKV